MAQSDLDPLWTVLWFTLCLAGRCVMICVYILIGLVAAILLIPND